MEQADEHSALKLHDVVEQQHVAHQIGGDDLFAPDTPKASKRSKMAACFDDAPTQKRFIVALLAFFGFCNIYTMRANLSVAIVEMTKEITVKADNGSDTTIRNFDWSEKQQGVLLSSFFYGYILTQLPGGYLAGKFGGKLLFGGGILATALLTLLTPVAASISFYLIVFVRIVEGLCEGVTYPAMHSIWSHWAPPLERSKLATFAFSGSYVGTVLTMPLSGLIATWFGWPFVFYVFGLLAIIWVICWWYFIYDRPADHPTIDAEEKNMLASTITASSHYIDLRRMPWVAIMTSPPVWAIIVAHFCENWGFYTLLTESPKYMTNVLKFTLERAGVMSALPYLAMALVLQIGGQVADYLRSSGKLSTTATRKVFTCTGFSCQVLFILCSSVTTTQWASVLLLTLAIGLGGLAWSGFAVNHLDIAPQYAGVLMGVSNTFATIPGIISPLLTGNIIKNQTHQEWQVVFFIAAALYLTGVAVYGALASGERMEWAEEETPPHGKTSADGYHEELGGGGGGGDNY